MIQWSSQTEFEWPEVCDEVGRLFGGVTAFDLLDVFAMHGEHTDSAARFHQFSEMRWNGALDGRGSQTTRPQEDIMGTLELSGSGSDVVGAAMIAPDGS